MAQVGEAYIVVRAITDGVANDIKKGLSGIDDSVGDRVGQKLGKSFSRGFNKSNSNNIFGKIADGIGTLAPNADAARESFQKLTKGGFYLQTIVSTLAGAIASVVGGLIGLAGTAVGAVPAFASLANIMVGLKIGMGVAKLALSGVGEAVQQATQLTSQYGSVAAAVGLQMKQLAFDAEQAALSERRAGLSLEQARENLLAAQQLPPNSRARREAELAYEEADLAYRRAQEQQDAADKANKKGAAGGANDPFGSLTPSQKEFAQFLVTLQTRLKDLKEAAASGFLPILQEQLGRINKTYFPVLLDGFKKVGTSVGNATKSITDMLVQSKNVKRIEKVFAGSAVIVEKLGELLAGLFEGFLIVLNAAQPQAERFLNFLIDKIGSFNTLLENSDLEAIFQRSGDIAADLGEVFGNVFGGLGAIVKANFGPDSGGQYLLDWLKTATGDWEAINNSPDGQKKLKKYFQDVAVNAKIIFQTIGKFFDELSGLGSDPNIGKAFTTLQEAAPFVGEIFRNGAKAGPALAGMVVEIAEFLSLMADAEAPKIFFETLGNTLKFINDMLNNKTTKAVVDFLGRIFAVLLAFGNMIRLAKFFGNVFLGSLKALFGPLGKVFGYFKNDGGLSKFQEHILKVRYGFENVQKKAKSAYETIALKGMYAKDKIVSAFDTMKLKAMYAKDAIVKSFKSGFETVQLKGMYAKDKIVDGFKAIGTWAKNTGSKIATAFKSAGTMIGQAGTAIGGVTKKLALNTIQVLRNVGAWIAQKAAVIGAAIASGILRAAQIAQNIVTAIATGIQAAFNFVMALNPITLIVIGVLALIAALIWFFTQTELGKQIFQGFIDFMKGAFDFLMTAFKAVGDFFVAVWNGLVAALKFVFDLIVAAIQFYISIWVNIFKTIVGFIIAVWNGLVDGISTAIGWVVGFFEDAWNGVVNFFKGFVNFLIGLFEGFINFVIDGLNMFTKPLRDAIGGLASLVGMEVTIGVIPKVKLPRLAKGGVVSPSPGGSLVNVAEAGKPERIEPLDADGLSKRDKALMKVIASGGGAGGRGNNITVIVNPGPDMDIKELAAEVSRRLAFTMRKGAAI